MSRAAPQIAFVTMVRDDAYFLRLWIAHCAAHAPRAHLFILFDGLDQVPPPEATGCQCLFLPRAEMGPGWDARRWAMLSDFAATLLGRFDVVAVNDVDELLVNDPATGETLPQALARATEVGAISPFALEVVHRPDLEPALDKRRPVLSQRRYVRLNASYCKPCVIAQPVRWSVGGHYSSHPRLHLDTSLYLFHLRYLDRDMLLARQAARQAAMPPRAADEAQVAGGGWAKTSDEVGEFLQSLQDRGAPVEGDFQFDWQRRRITSGWHYDDSAGIWRHPKLHNRKTYVLPPRFRGQF
jgi:hypothetical protein